VPEPPAGAPPAPPPPPNRAQRFATRAWEIFGPDDLDLEIGTTLGKRGKYEDDGGVSPELVAKKELPFIGKDGSISGRMRLHDRRGEVVVEARDPLVNGKLRLRNKEQLSWRKGWLLGPWAVAPSVELISCLDLTTGKPEGQMRVGLRRRPRGQPALRLVRDFDLNMDREFLRYKVGVGGALSTGKPLLSAVSLDKVDFCIQYPGRDGTPKDEEAAPSTSAEDTQKAQPKWYKRPFGSSAEDTQEAQPKWYKRLR
jgi:hypothetical protein